MPRRGHYDISLKKREKNMEALHLKEVLFAVGGTAIWLGKATSESTENVVIEKVSTNSRDEMNNGLFVPIIGERVDAHDFILGAFENGAVVCFTSRHKSIDDVMKDEKLNGQDYTGKVMISVENTLEALQKLATYYRDKFTIPIIGISGSVGKTTTKEMISAALETKYRVLKTFGNMNSQIGVALMMFELDKDKDIAVIEMGISEPNEMNHLNKIAKPQDAVLTNIGVSHIANLKTRENIRKEKAKIVNAFDENSTLYVNGNDDLLREIYLDAQNVKKGGSFQIDLDQTTKEKLQNSQVLAFGTNEDCLYHAIDIKTENEKTSFTMVYPGGSEEVHLQVCGIHNVYNALVALAIANKYGISPKIAKEGLATYEPIKMRGQIFNYGKIKVIDDTYNASPDSMKSGINVLLDLSGVKRRIAILADVLELGELSEACHYGVGKYIADKKIDTLITVGEQAKFIAKAIKDKKSEVQTYSFDSNEQANDYLGTFVKEGDGILVKGSRGMHTEKIVEFLRKQHVK